MVHQAPAFSANVKPVTETVSDALRFGFLALRNRACGRLISSDSSPSVPCEYRAFPRSIARQQPKVVCRNSARGLSCRAASTDPDRPTRSATATKSRAVSSDCSAGSHRGSAATMPVKSVGLADSLLQAAESLINSSLTDPPGKFFLSGNFAPTEEKGPISDLAVEGVLPVS